MNLLIEDYTKNYPSEVGAFILQHSAEVLAEWITNLSPDSASAVLNIMPIQVSANILSKIDEDIRLQLIEKLYPGYIAAILRNFDDQKRTFYLAKLSSAVFKRVEPLLICPSNSIGKLTLSPTMPLSAETTVRQAATIINKNRQLFFEYIFIVDKDNKLVGNANINDLLMSNTGTRKLIEVAADKNPFLFVRDTIEQAQKHLAWKTHRVLPVVYSTNEVIGVVDYYTLINAQEFEGSPKITEASIAVGEVLLAGLKLVASPLELNREVKDES